MTGKDISHDVLILIFVVKTLENHKSTGHNWVGQLGQLFKVAEQFVQYVLCPFMTSRNVEIFFLRIPHWQSIDVGLEDIPYVCRSPYGCVKKENPPSCAMKYVFSLATYSSSAFVVEI